MSVRKIVTVGLVIVLTVPPVAILGAVGWISMLDRSNGEIASSGETREYLLHVPDSYDPAEPTPLVISLHAGATWPAQQANLTGWNRLADEHGFLVVYPSGTPQLLNVVRIWRTFGRGPRLERDVRFISDLIDTLQVRYNVDPARVYANGMSNGGGMAFVLSCVLPDRIAAVGTVAPAHSLPPEWCADAPPVPVIGFHGTADPIALYEGGPIGDPFSVKKPVLPGAREFVGNWAQRNGCAADPVESSFPRDVRRLKYRNCAEDAEVVLYTVIGGGHTWPGGKPMPEWRVGPTSDAIDATRRMWKFFARHPLRGRQDVQIGVGPNRSDFPTSIDGVEFDAAWANRITADVEGIEGPVPGREDLIRHEKAVGRTSGSADIEELDSPRQEPTGSFSRPRADF